MSKTIEEVAREFAEREAEIGSIDRDALYKGFYWGARHVLSLPLSERLNEAEKNEVRDILNYYYGRWHKWPNEATEGAYCAIKETLEDIFGKVMFNE